MPGANLREYYHGAMRPIWWLGVLTVFLATIFRPLIFGFDLFSADNATSLVLGLGFIVVATSNRYTVHAIFVPVFLLLVLLDIFQWSFVISPN
jgi:hypothetical protein